MTTPKKTPAPAIRLTRGDSFRIMKWMEDNRELLEFESTKVCMEFIKDADLPACSVPSFIQMRKELGWAIRKHAAGTDTTRIAKLEETVARLEKRIKTAEVLLEIEWKEEKPAT